MVYTPIEINANYFNYFIKRQLFIKLVVSDSRVCCSSYLDYLNNVCNGMNLWHTALYADGIPLISHYVTDFELLLHACVQKVNGLACKKNLLLCVLDLVI